MSSVAVLIPCYNEAKTIDKVVRDFKNALPDADIYVYDNNSSDGTDEIARRAGAIVRYENRQGKGNVIRTMFREIDADCYLIIDGDDTYPAENAEQMVEFILSGKADMVIGDRLSSTYFTENKRPFHNSGNKSVRWLINTIFNGKINDIMTGYRAFSYDFVKTFPVLCEGFEIETEMSIHALRHNLKISEIPVQYRDRPDGSVSKLNTFSDGFKVIRTIFKLFKNYRPFAFFSALSMILFIIGTVLFIPIFAEFLSTHAVPKFPTLIMDGVIYMCSLLLFICGLILDTINSISNQQFELNYINLKKKRESKDE